MMAAGTRRWIAYWKFCCHWFNNFDVEHLPMCLLFYTLWIQFTLESGFFKLGPCLEFFAMIFPGHFWGQESLKALLDFVIIKSPSAPVLQLPAGSVIKNPPAAGDMGSIPWVRKLLVEEMATHCRALAWENPMGQSSLLGHSPRVTQSQTWLSD